MRFVVLSTSGGAISSSFKILTDFALVLTSNSNNERTAVEEIAGLSPRARNNIMRFSLSSAQMVHC